MHYNQTKKTLLKRIQEEQAFNSCKYSGTEAGRPFWDQGQALGYTVSSRGTWVVWEDPVLKIQTKAKAKTEQNTNECFIL